MFVFLDAAASPPLLFFSAASIRFALDYKYPLPRRRAAEAAEPASPPPPSNSRVSLPRRRAASIAAAAAAAATPRAIDLLDD